MMPDIGALTLALALAPALAIVLILLIRRARAAEALNLAASAVSLLAILMILALRNESGLTFWGSYVIIDGLGTWTILCAAIVYFLASVYAIGYMRLLDQEDRLYRFYALFAGFALSTLIGPMMNNAGLYWIAIELTTLISTFLVAFEREAESIEAAWKYIIVVSAGISLALLGTVLFYWSGTERRCAVDRVGTDELRRRGDDFGENLEPSRGRTVLFMLALLEVGAVALVRCDRDSWNADLISAAVRLQ